ncbi:MAG: MAB_1171c family putative transporter [Labedaea sp.]
MGTANATHLLLVTLAGLAVVYRFRSVRRNPGDRAVRAVFLALLCFEVGFGLGYPEFYWFVHRLLGELPGIPQLFQHIAGMMMAYYAAVLMVCVKTPEEDLWARDRLLRVRRRWLVVAVGILFGCYLLGPVRLGIPLIDTSGQQDWGITGYVIAWQLYAAVTLVDTVRLRRHGLRTENRYLRIGLNLMATGYVCVAVQMAHKVTYQLLAGFGIRLPWQESGPHGVQILFLAPAVTCIMVGVTIPSWGPRVALWRDRLRAYRRLTPMIADLRKLVPANPPAAAARTLRDRLHQRTIFIRDALTGPLRTHLDPRVFDLASQRCTTVGLSEQDALATAEAACIAAAIRDRGGVTTPVDRPGRQPARPTGKGLDAEAEWLGRVGHAYVHSQVVRDILAATLPAPET